MQKAQEKFLSISVKTELKKRHQ